MCVCTAADGAVYTVMDGVQRRANGECGGDDLASDRCHDGLCARWVFDRVFAGRVLLQNCCGTWGGRRAWGRAGRRERRGRLRKAAGRYGLTCLRIPEGGLRICG